MCGKREVGEVVIPVFLTDEQMGSSGGWSPLAPGSKWESDLGSDLQAPFSSSGMTEESSLGY